MEKIELKFTGGEGGGYRYFKAQGKFRGGPVYSAPEVDALVEALEEMVEWAEIMLPHYLIDSQPQARLAIDFARLTLSRIMGEQSGNTGELEEKP